MIRTLRVVRVFVAVAGVVQIGLGLFVRMTGELSWMPAHAVLGLSLIAGIWLETLLASRVRVGLRRCIATAVLAAALPLFGVAQVFVPAGPGNWALMAAHLIAAVGAIHMAQRVGIHAERRLAGLRAGGNRPGGLEGAGLGTAAA